MARLIERKGKLMDVLESKWIQAYEECDAFWMHNGDPAAPHAELTSGKHSNGFFNSSKVAQHPLVLADAARSLLDLLRRECDISQVSRVVGPAMGAITLAQEVARNMALVPGSGNTFSAYAMKNPETGILESIKPEINQEELTLAVEDVVTTGGSVQAALDLIEEMKATPHDYVLSLVNRSGEDVVGGRKIISLVNRHLPIWEPDECPLCQEGSAAIRPKDNWAELTA